MPGGVYVLRDINRFYLIFVRFLLSKCTSELNKKQAY